MISTRHRARGLAPSLAILLALAFALAASAGCRSSAALEVHRISKDQGVPGDTLIIFGSGFQATATRRVTVYFGGKKAKVKQFAGDEEIYVEVPGGNEMGQTVDIELIFEPGGSKKLAKAFKYTEISRLEVDDLGKQDSK